MGKNRHPSPQRIDRYLRGVLQGAARDALERHFMACDACFERVRLELGAEMVGAGAGEPEGGKARARD